MEITKDDFLAYEQVRVSGLTNMFDVSNVQKLSGLTREKIFEIMKNYVALKGKWNNQDGPFIAGPKVYVIKIKWNEDEMNTQVIAESEEKVVDYVLGNIEIEIVSVRRRNK